MSFIFFCQKDATAAYSKSITDMAGRRVEIPENPTKIIGLSASIVEILFCLGKGSSLAGAVSYSDYPEEAKMIPRVGSYNKPDLERIIAMKPDLCIAMKDGNPEESIRKIEKLGISVLVVDTSTIDGIYRSIELLGDALGKKSEAEKTTKTMKDKIESVGKMIGKNGKRPRIIFEVNQEPLILAGKNTFIDEMISLAGGDNAVHDGPDYPRMTREMAVSLMPDVIIISGMVNEAPRNTWWQGYKNVPAVKNNRIHNVSPDAFLRPTPRVADCITDLASLIHKENQTSKDQKNGE